MLALANKIIKNFEFNPKVTSTLIKKNQFIQVYCMFKYKFYDIRNQISFT